MQLANTKHAYKSYNGTIQCSQTPSKIDRSLAFNPKNIDHTIQHNHTPPPQHKHNQLSMHYTHIEIQHAKCIYMDGSFIVTHENIVGNMAFLGV